MRPRHRPPHARSSRPQPLRRGEPAPGRRPSRRHRLEPRGPMAGEARPATFGARSARGAHGGGPARRQPGPASGRILSSTLARASETAAIIGASVGVEVEPEPRLVEIGAGEWEGRTHAELAAIDGERYRAWRTTPGYGPPGGEPIPEATERVRSLLADVAASEPWPVLLVSHGGTLRIFARLLLDVSAERAEAVDIDNASVSSAVRTGGGDVAARALERRAAPARPRAHPRRRGRGTPPGTLTARPTRRAE